MPNRILSARIHISNSISKLNPLEEVVFIHLIMSCDDYGRYFGDAEILKGHMFPKRGFSAKQIEDALAKLEAEGMIERYSVDGIKYLALKNWMKYQKPRAKESKHPAPDQANEVTPIESECEQPVAVDSKCDQKQEDEIIVSMILNDGTMYDVTVSDAKHYEELYPAVDVRQALRNMTGWCEANKAKRKTRGGIKSFINTWLAKEQNSGGSKKKTYISANAEPAPGENPFKRFVEGK